MNKSLLSLATVTALSLLCACATVNDPTAGLSNAEKRVHTVENGDVIEEYRFAGQLRVVKVTPAHGAVYYLEDKNRDGLIDKKDDIAPVYWKIFGW